MVVTDSTALADRCAYFRNVCFPPDAPRTYLHADIGFNYRMSNLHAAIGLAQVERADFYRERRVHNGLLYHELLAQIPGVTVQEEQTDGACVYWMNGLALTPDYGRSRAELLAHLRENGVETRLFFNGMHRQPALQHVGCDCAGEYPISDFLADNGFYLPSGSGLQEEDIRRVCGLIRAFGRGA